MSSHETVNRRSTLLAACGVLATVVTFGCTQDPISSTSRFNATSNPPPSTTASVPTPMPTEPAAFTVPFTPPAPPSAEEIRIARREGSVLYDRSEYAAAAAQLEIASTGSPDDPRIQYLLGLALWKSGKPDLAEPVLARAAQLDPTSVKTFTNLARVRLDLEEAATAFAAAGSAVALNATSSAALHQKGRALAMLNRRDEALETLRFAHDADPSDGYISNTLGYWLIQTGSFDEAIPLLESARDRLGSVAYVRNNLGVAYERTGRRDEAIVEYRAAVGSGDSGGKAALSLARLGASIDTGLASGTPSGTAIAQGMESSVEGQSAEPPQK